MLQRANKSPKKVLKISAVGDVVFVGMGCLEPKKNVFERVKSAWDHSDVVIANLETVLYKGPDLAGNKCLLKGDPLWADFLAGMGIHVVSLANNHLMDYGPVGLLETLKALDRAGVRHFGAGRDVAEALAPLYVDDVGTRMALLGRSSVIVSSPCYASGESPGVAPFDLEETKQAIKASKKQAKITAVSLHWGVEHYKYPTPTQRRYVRALIEAGADVILGHHPHVLQGVERINRGLVSYSLGNLLFNDVRWSFVDMEGHLQERVVRLSEANRKGGILKVAFSENVIESYDFIPTLIQADGMVILDGRVERKLEFDRLCSRLHLPGYGLFWKAYSIKQEWLLRIKPLIYGKMTWSNLKKVRPRHFKELGTKFKRSARITSERSTNPYE